MDELVKRRRGEAGAEALCPQLDVDRSVDYKIIFQGTHGYL